MLFFKFLNHFFLYISGFFFFEDFPANNQIFSILKLPNQTTSPVTYRFALSKTHIKCNAFLKSTKYLLLLHLQ